MLFNCKENMKMKTCAKGWHISVIEDCHPKSKLGILKMEIML